MVMKFSLEINRENVFKNEALNNKIDQLKHLKYLDILDMMSIKVSFLCCKILENKKKI